MCGITGVILSDLNHNNANAYVDEVEAMTNSLIHRGPDGFGYVGLQPYGNGADVKQFERTKNIKSIPIESKVIFGHRRLSIIDVNGTPQPLKNEDGTVWVTFNGEIYNYKELAKDLARKGHIIREAGDTEILVHLWEEYGEAMLHHLNGMFAFAIYDSKRDILFLARDRFGEKPLYYRHNQNILAFASELQAFWPQQDFKKSLCKEALNEYLKHAYIPSPQTIYKDIFAVPAGNSLTLNRRDFSIEVKRYWKPDFDCVKHFDYEEFEEKLLTAVNTRLVADVPLGVFLSGGLDSSIIAHSASHSIKQLKTFHISTSGNNSAESNTAEEVAKSISSQHRSLSIEADFAKTSEHLARHYGQPFADFSSIPTYLVSKATKQHVSVALSGDGGDEVFFGYDRYFTLAHLRRLSYFPECIKSSFAEFAIKNRIKHLSSNTLDLLLSSQSPTKKGENRSHMFHEYWLEKLTGSHQRVSHTMPTRYGTHYANATSPLPNRWSEVDQVMYLPDDILTKVDIASMACSLECRAPLLDHELVEYMNQLDLSVKTNKGKSGKAVLKQYACKHLPKSVLALKKTGFTIPLDHWLRKELKEWSHSLLFSNKSLCNELFDQHFVAHLWNQHQKQEHDHGMRLWQLIAIELWREQVSSVNS